MAQQATQNLGQSGNATGNNFDFANLFQGGSTFDRQQTQAAPTPPVQQNTQATRPTQDFLGAAGGGGGTAAPVHGNSDHHIQLGNDKSGGGGRVDPGGANN